MIELTESQASLLGMMVRNQEVITEPSDPVLKKLISKHLVIKCGDYRSLGIYKATELGRKALIRKSTGEQK